MRINHKIINRRIIVNDQKKSKFNVFLEGEKIAKSWINMKESERAKQLAHLCTQYVDSDDPNATEDEFANIMTFLINKFNS